MIQLKVIPVFPSNVQGSNVVTVTKANGIWTIGLDISVLDTPVITDSSVYEVMVRNTLDDSYGRIPVNAFLASAYLPVVITGDHNVSATETFLRCELTAAAAINLPPSADRDGLDLDIKDSSGNFTTYNATITPDGSETIDGMAELVGNIDFMFFKLRPKTNGWEIVARG